MKSIGKKEKKYLKKLFLKELKILNQKKSLLETSGKIKAKESRLIEKVYKKLKKRNINISKKELKDFYKKRKELILKKFEIENNAPYLIFLGSGHALPEKSYNTCFVVKNREDRCFLIDTGGGNQILTQLRNSHINLEQIEDIFISHIHLDHLMGLFWILRVIGYDLAAGKRHNPLRIYACPSVLKTIKEGINLFSGNKVKNLIGKEIILTPVQDGKELNIIGFPIVFFNIYSKKIEQYGFTLRIADKTLAFLGDEPFRESEKNYAFKPHWLIHEAFCLDKDKERFKPTEKMHSTVKEAAENAEFLEAQVLFITHSEDYKDKVKVFKKEAEKYFNGKVYVVEDLSTFHLT